jgi:hypothetical protein
MNSAAIARRVAANHLLQKQAGLKDWMKWFAQPFKVIWKHHREFVKGPIDDAVDAIIKDLAPILVRAIGEKEVEEDLADFTDGANAGKWDAERGNIAAPSRTESSDFSAGYSWGFEHAGEFRNTLPPAVKRKVIENALKVYRKTITEEVLERVLHQVWSAINPKHTFDAIMKAVKKHGWKLGVGFALFEIFEHFALPALLVKMTGDPKMLAFATLPIGEVIYAVVFRILGRTPKELDDPTAEGHLDWYEKNFGKVRLASASFPSFDQWQDRWFVYKHACLANDPMNLPSIGRSVDRMVTNAQGVDIYFDDGSWVSASVDQPGEDEEGGCGCGGDCGGSCGCGGKTAAGEATVDLVAAVRGNELLGAKDSSQMGAKTPGVWMFSGAEAPFGLFMLSGVPLKTAEQVVDFGTRGGRLKDGNAVWKLIKRYSARSPFKAVR